jgi:uncharacterized protein
MAMRHDIAFESGGTRCAAWHYTAATDDLREPAGRPCVVMAHGFGGTRDAGMAPFAEAFADAGLDVLLFDYRGFGASAGMPRQAVSYRRQRADYHAAIAATRRLPDVDPARIVVWGTSYSGGHVLAVAAQDPSIAAVIAMNPAADGLAALLAIVRREGVGAVVKLSAAGLRDVASTALGRPPYLIPVAGTPGTLAVLAEEVAATAYPAIGGPTWRNECCGRSALGVALNRPIRMAAKVGVPLLVQVGDADVITPAAAAEKAAKLAGPLAEVRRYPTDHMGFYDGPSHPAVVADQVQFLRRHFAGSPASDWRLAAR